MLVSRLVALPLVHVADHPLRAQRRGPALASTIGQCYGVRPAYSDDDVDETIAFVDLPGSVSIYVNGAGETLTISIGSTFSIPEPYPQAP